MIILLFLFACNSSTAQADTYEHNNGVVRVEFSDAVCFCLDQGGGWPCRNDGGVSCISKPALTVGKTP